MSKPEWPLLALSIMSVLFQFDAAGHRAVDTMTPIRHLVMIYPENVSFNLGRPEP